MNQRKNVKKIKVRKIKIGKVFLALIVFSFIFFLLIRFIDKKIKNINIVHLSLNNLLKDQYIIDISGLNDYPSSIKNPTSKIKRKLEANKFIKEATVSKSGLYSVYIEIKENRILFYNDFNKKYILEDKSEISYEEIINLYPKVFTHIPSVPILVIDEKITDKVYEDLILSMSDIDDSTLYHISEIKYAPTEVEEERFLFTMTDGNYVYITPNRMYLINKYLDTVVKVDGTKGTLFLDYKSYFVFE